MVIAFSMTNPRWADKTFSNKKLKIKDFGCAIVSLACLVGKTPNIICDILERNNCFTSEGLLDFGQAGKALGYDYYKTLKEPDAICIAETNFWNKAPYFNPKHFFVWLATNPLKFIIDSLDGKEKQNEYPVVSWRIFIPRGA